MSTERERRQAARRAIRREYGDLYERVLRILFDADPVGINFGDNADEYEPEVDTILPRLRTCTSAADVQRVVHEEFCRWFDAELAGEPNRYGEIASKVWSDSRSASATDREGLVLIPRPAADEPASGSVRRRQ
jgi:hypothetical protein